MKKFKLLLADDHQVVRNGIKLMLEHQDSFNAEVDEAVDGEEAVQKSNKKYDLIILDIHLPKMDGINAAKKILSKNQSQKILILSMYTENYIVKEAISTGVMGYILKNTGVEELTKAIMTIMNGQKYYDNDITQILMGADSSSGPSGNKIINPSLGKQNLTKRELEILELIAQENTSADISKKLCISKRTVDGHRKRIMEKLDVGNVVGLVKYALQNGIG